MTTRGFKELEAEQLANMIADGALMRQAILRFFRMSRSKEGVVGKFPVYQR